MEIKQDDKPNPTGGHKSRVVWRNPDLPRHTPEEVDEMARYLRETNFDAASMRPPPLWKQAIFAITSLLDGSHFADRRDRISFKETLRMIEEGEERKKS